MNVVLTAACMITVIDRLTAVVNHRIDMQILRCMTTVMTTFICYF